jgi:hypothetical protein
MDADWATDQIDRKSISGYLSFLYNTLVSWLSTKQKTIELSSTEAEYMAMVHAMKEALWIRLFLSLSKLPHPRPFPLLCDNMGAMEMANSNSTSSRAKHIDICYHFLHKHIQSGSFETSWVPTADMTADILTKSLPFPAHSKHVAALGLVTRS